jgi:hypothetical protein
MDVFIPALANGLNPSRPEEPAPLLRILATLLAMMLIGVGL